ncbi:MAG: hypothetical protein A3J28_02720 [Acidobacteria bacterium RIFCSPLOWO2_12_FULL_60_22]|nr:MAG: hypothetical protein A3J28_02720 [Acidobacteria bacterium RIFCSPLOWO2_12_FULL_60_22]
MLAPELAEELRYIEITASRRIRSLRYGQSRSPIRGSGYEFETHLKYTIGEDLRRVDWNVSARMQELYLKRQFEEREVTVFLVVDVSRSMDFSTAAHSKRTRVLQVAAALGFSAASDSCNFGFLAFSDRVEAFEAARKGRGHVWRAIDQLYNLQPKRRGTDWGLALRFLRSHLRRMSIIFLLSDFITDPAATGLAELPDLKVLAQRHDVVPVIFGDQIEANLPVGRGLLRFRSAESGQEMLLSLSSSQRKRFETFVEGRKEDLQSLFYSLGMECLFLQVGQPFMDPLMTLFERRRKI